MAHKAAVIADSDGESDVDIAPSIHSQSSPRKDHGQAPPDIDLDVNFSDFLSQSQKHDMTDKQQAAAPTEDHSGGAEKSTGTTASLQRQIESEQRRLAEQHKTSSSGQPSSSTKFRIGPHSSDSPIEAKTKRRHSELVTTGETGGERPAKSRRQKTYGSSSSSHLRSSQSVMFMEEHRDHDDGVVANDPSSGNVTASSGQQGDPTTSHPTHAFAEPVQSHDGAYERDSASFDHNDIQPQQRLDSAVNLDALNHVQMSSGRISTSRSLMGNYESINLDFRGTETGLDVNANPFGEASQNSAEDHDRPDQQRLEAIFPPPVTAAMDTPAVSRDHDDNFHSLDHNHYTIDEEAILQNPSPLRAASVRSKSYIDPSVLTKHPSDDTQETLPSKALSRKRRKTSDGLAVNITNRAQDQDSLVPTLAAMDSPMPKVERQGKKRGRKPKNQVSELERDLHPEWAEEQVEKGDTDSGKGKMEEKNPSSALLLDDESAIGLPKEQYKPRPSRSRSKRQDEEAMPPPASTPIKSQRTPVKQNQTTKTDDTFQGDEPEDTPLTKLKKEKKRKNKMKRAKTSAAALLKKSEKMLSDGEDDVVWVESKPAAVKMKLPDPLEVKREEDLERRSEQTPCLDNNNAEPADTVNVMSNEQSIENRASEANEISVDIPQSKDEPEPEPLPPPQPKKRGRKKKSIPIEVEIPALSEDKTENSNKTYSTNPSNTTAELHETEEKTSAHNAACSSSRPPLASKDPNSMMSTSTPQKAKTNADTAQENTATTTPSPTKPTPTTEKGPTKHSPINPSGGKVRYRVGLSKRAAIPPLLKIVRK